MPVTEHAYGFLMSVSSILIDGEADVSKKVWLSGFRMSCSFSMQTIVDVFRQTLNPETLKS